LRRAAHGDDVAQGRLQAELPELADVVLARQPRVVGHEGHALAGAAQVLDGLDGARRQVVAHVDGPVQVHDELVV
jgi:hypothetical protein